MDEAAGVSTGFDLWAISEDSAGCGEGGGERLKPGALVGTNTDCVVLAGVAAGEDAALLAVVLGSTSVVGATRFAWGVKAIGGSFL